jgi:hypothetical protein
MQKLKESLGDYEMAKVVRLQRLIRGFLARRRCRALRNNLIAVKQAAMEAALKAKREAERMSRMSFISIPSQSIVRGQDVLKLRFRRASEIVSTRSTLVSSKNELSFGNSHSWSPKNDKNMEAPVDRFDGDASCLCSSSSSGSDSEEPVGSAATLVAGRITELTGSRATTSTPLGLRLKRPLDAEVARMGGLRKHHVNVIRKVRRQPSKTKTQRRRLGSFTLPTDEGQEDTSHTDGRFCEISISLPGKEKKPAKSRSGSRKSRKDSAKYNSV